MIKYKRKNSELETWTEKKRLNQVSLHHIQVYLQSPIVEILHSSPRSVQSMDIDSNFDDNFLDHKFWRISPDEYISSVENSMT